MPSGMIECEESGTVLLEENISDGDGTYFGRARVYTSAGGLSSTTNINHVAGGLYQGTVAAPVVGKYSVLYDWFEDAGRTTPAGTAKTGVENTSTQLRVKALPAEPGDAMDLVTDAVDANAVATTGANEIRDTILSDSTAFDGADIAAILADTAAIDTLTSTNLDVVVSTRATQAQILSDATPFPGANIDAAITSRSSHSAADVDTTLTGTHGAGSWTSASALTAQNVRDAMKLAPTVGAPAAGSVDEHLDDVLADTAAMQPTIATNLDATVSSRGTADPGDAMDLVASAIVSGTYAAGAITATAIANDAIGSNQIATNAIGSNEMAVSAINEIRDGILSDSTQFAGADIAAILADTAAMQPTVATNLDTTISSRAATGDDMGLISSAITSGTFAADAIDASAIAADAIGASELATSAVGEIADGVWDELIAGHLGVGSTGEALNNAAAGSTLTPQQVRDAMKLAPTGGVAAAGSVDEHLDDILADTAAIQPTVATNLDATVSSRSSLTAQNARDAMKLSPTVGAPGSGSVDEHLDDVLADTAAMQPTVATNLDTTVSSRSSHTAANVDTQLTGTHGAGSWTSASALTAQNVRDAMKLAPTAGAPVAGSVDEHLDDILADTSAIDARLPSDPADESLLQASHATTQADIAALNDLSQADVQTALTSQGYTAARAPNLDNIGTTALVAADVTSAVWDAVKASFTTTGSMGEAILAAAGHAGLHSVLDGGAGQAAVIHNGNNNLTAARLRIFANKAAADAATLGAADGADSELKRLNFDSATYSLGSTSAVPEVLDATRRTSS